VECGDVLAGAGIRHGGIGFGFEAGAAALLDEALSASAEGGDEVGPGAVGGDEELELGGGEIRHQILARIDAELAGPGAEHTGAPLQGELIKSAVLADGSDVLSGLLELLELLDRGEPLLVQRHDRGRVPPSGCWRAVRNQCEP
jgi:hypothetical protein